MSQKVTNSPVSEGEDDERFLSIADLRRRYGKSRMTIHRWVQAGHLPAPVRIGARSLGFRLSEILALEQSRQCVPHSDQAA